MMTDEAFCTEHGMFHSQEMRSPDCSFEDGLGNAISLTPSVPTPDEDEREALVVEYEVAWSDFEALGEENRDLRWRDFLLDRLITAGYRSTPTPDVAALIAEAGRTVVAARETAADVLADGAVIEDDEDRAALVGDLNLFADLIDRLVAALRVSAPETVTERAPVITLCGSTKFKDEFVSENTRLTMEGNVVISLGLFGHTDLPDYDWTTDATDLKRTLDRLHFQKIDMADRVHVINVDGYIGESTYREIMHAWDQRKRITYMEPKQCSCDDGDRHPLELPCGWGDHEAGGGHRDERFEPCWCRFRPTREEG